MSFVSYAQNLEDVMLYRALRDVRQGFYIDVGAQDPIVDSVTNAFYERGWHGINIEPNEEYFQKLQSERRRDINLPTALGAGVGVTGFYEVAHTGLSTTDAEYAQRHAQAGHRVKRRDVRCTTLDRICADWGVATVHFLKIDVEGSERAVLEGFSFETVRPWLVVIEATEPNSDHQIYAEWEDLLIRRNYQFIYFDGLNRFYASEERRDLAQHFTRPPNWFDKHVGYELCCARRLIAERDWQLRTLRSSIFEQERRLDSLQTDLRAARQRLTSMRASISWKITSPFRELGRAASRLSRLFQWPNTAAINFALGGSFPAIVPIGLSGGKRPQNQSRAQNGDEPKACSTTL